MLKEKNIIYVQYTNPACYPPLMHSSRLLADRLWKVYFFGTRSLGQSNLLEMESHPNISSKQFSYYHGGPAKKINYLWFIFSALTTVFRKKPGWIYASDPFSCPPALLSKKIFKTKVIYHEHDFPHTKDPSIFMKIVFWFRKVMAAQADICILPNKERKDKFDKEIHASRLKSVSVFNCPLKEEASIKKTDKGKDGISVVYHGSVGPNRISLKVLEAIALIPESIKLKIIGYETAGYRGYAEEIRKKACSIGIADRVTVAGVITTREKLLMECRKHDIGLSLVSSKSSDRNELSMAGASNKAFDYMACGLAVIVSDSTAWQKMYVEPGYGVSCDPNSVESMAKALRYFIEHPAKIREMGELGRQRILKDWNYEYQFAPVLKTMEPDD